MPTSHLRALTQPDTEAPEPTGGAGEERQLSCPVTLQRYEKGKLRFRDDRIAVESDIRLNVDGQRYGVLSRTPGDDMNLVAGYLFSRSMIRGPEDIESISFGYRGLARATVTLKTSAAIRRIYPEPRPAHLAPEHLFRFKETFEQRQRLYKHTGSTHAAALFTLDGELIAFGEDVGRHNAFDKAIGKSLLEGTLDQAAIAVLSSRLALELAVKASTANIPILCGFSAATSSGINYAEKNNITLVGRLKSDSFNVYANGWRLMTT